MKKVVFIDLWNTVSHGFIMFFQGNQKWRVLTKNKISNPIFVDEETIPMVQDEDYDNYGTPNESRVDETSFTEPGTIAPTIKAKSTTR